MLAFFFHHGHHGAMPPRKRPAAGHGGAAGQPAKRIPVPDHDDDGDDVSALDAKIGPTLRLNFESLLSSASPGHVTQEYLHASLTSGRFATTKRAVQA